MPELVFKSKGKEKVFSLQSKEITIGRSPSNNLVLDDPAASRNHARIICEEEKYIIFDLGTKNGTWVNGQRRAETILKQDDQIRIGTTVLHFKEGARTQIFYPQEDADIDKSSTIIKHIPSYAELYSKEHKRLEIVYNISRAIGGIFELDSLIEKVLELLFDIINADRILIMLKSEHTGKLFPKMAKRKDGTLESEISVSQTMVERVVSEGVSILVSDAQADERFKKAQSLILKGVRSVMCVPLWNKEKMFGLLYVDSHRKGVPFLEADLDLLTAIANQIAVAIENLQIQEELFRKRRFEQELEIAANIQQSFLPAKFPEIAGFKFAAKSLPALNVGGDFYDFFQLPQNKWGFVIGDVAGKGVPAALYMARFISEFHRLSSTSDDPVQFLSDINALFYEWIQGRAFVAVTYIVLDTKTSELFFVCAGHRPPKLFQKNTSKVIDLASYPNEPLGVTKEVSFQQGQVKLMQSDSVILYTDGLSEAQNKKGEFLGMERLDQIINKHYKLSASEMVDQILENVNQYTRGKEQFDDQTILVLKKENK